MGFRINTNIAALNAQRHLSNISNKLDKSLERLSSGLRINKAADGASEMATSVYLRGQIGGLRQAARNANDAISMTQTAEGALDVSTSILLRLRELSVQAATDTTNRDLLISEANQLVAELSRVANDTEFVGNTLLNGSFQSGKIQVGANQGQTISFSIG
ncbi:MAG: flagellin, partial [Deltaproteobacteria bacterium]|nr:flagellin [Deltaproteobacteria bacterium]